MRKIFCILTVGFILAGCGKDNSNIESIIIKGTISGAAQIKSSNSKSENALDLTNAKKVLVFYGNTYTLSDITGNSFSVHAEMGSATALVFLDANNKYIGNLFTGGLNMLPLGNLADGETLIDLQTLNLDGTSVIPTHDPIGDEINISEEEITRIKELGGYFESLAKNIDTDNDGVPDILSKKNLKITSHFSIYGGKWGENTTAPTIMNVNQMFMNYAVRIEGNISMTPANGNNVALTGPVESPYNDIKTQRYLADKDCFISFFNRETMAPLGAPWGSAFLPFKEGTYTFTLDGIKKYTLNYANIDAKYYLLIATPTLHTNSEGKVTSVTIEYKRIDNTIVSPENFVTILQLQFENKDGSRQELGSLYESVKTNITLTDLTTVTLKEPIPLSNMWQLNINYNDFLGNEYDVIWRTEIRK